MENQVGSLWGFDIGRENNTFISGVTFERYHFGRTEERRVLNRAFKER